MKVPIRKQTMRCYGNSLMRDEQMQEQVKTKCIVVLLLFLFILILLLRSLQFCSCIAFRMNYSVFRILPSFRIY